MAFSWIPSLHVHCLNHLIAMFYFKLLSTEKFLFGVITSFHKGFGFFIRVLSFTLLVMSLSGSVIITFYLYQLWLNL